MTDSERINHMLNSIQKIQSVVENVTKETFLTTTMMQDAVLYNFAVLGEAAGRLSMELRQNNPDIPWKNIVGMRNILIHDYIKTDFSFVWNTIVADLEGLQRNLLRIKASL